VPFCPRPLHRILMNTYELGCFGALRAVVRNTFIHVDGIAGVNKNVDQPLLELEQPRISRRERSDITDARDLDAQNYKMYRFQEKERSPSVTHPSRRSENRPNIEAFNKDSELESPRPGVEAQVNVSLGSTAHETGTCKPCIWFWKSASCHRGDDCQHCHLCDAKEIKRRKKDSRRKHSSMQVPIELLPDSLPTVPSPVDCVANLTSLNDLMHTPRHSIASSDGSWDTEASTASTGLSGDSSRTNSDRSNASAMSMGSALHGRGECRPCVWFWRPTSCSKGIDCEYCHMCDEAAVDRAKELRKKDAFLRKKLKRCQL
jgi:hypothetical protein